MLLFFPRCCQRRNIHSNLTNSLISAEIDPENASLLDILKSVPSAKPPRLNVRGQIIDIYPFSFKDHLNIQTELGLNKIKFRISLIDKLSGFVIKDRMLVNFKPEGYKTFRSVIKREYYEIFNVHQSDEKRLLFSSCYSGDSSNVSRVHFLFKKDGIMKMSPNILQIRHIEGLDRSFLNEIFNDLLFHRISPPLTPKGVWRIYVANRYDYYLLLSRPYLFGSKLLDITPYYESSFILPIERNISPSQIYLYSKSDALSTEEHIQEAIPGLRDVTIRKFKYENGHFFIFHIKDRINFLNILYLNGSPLNGTIDYSMTFGDDITINNISSNILCHAYSKYPSTANRKKQTMIIRKIFPRNIKEFTDILHHGIQLNVHHVYPQQYYYPSHITFPNILFIRPKSNKITNEEINSIFDGIPIESICEMDNDSFALIFKPEHFEAARFRLKPDQKYYTNNTSFQTTRVLRDHHSYLFINHFIYRSDKAVDIPFEHRVIRNNTETFYCLTNLENYIKYCYKPIKTSQGSINLIPFRNKISKKPSFIKIYIEDAYEWIIDRCHHMNIPVDVDNSKLYVYPKFSSFNDLDRLTLTLFSECDIYPQKAGFYPGVDILDL